MHRSGRHRCRQRSSCPAWWRRSPVALWRSCRGEAEAVAMPLRSRGDGGDPAVGRRRWLGHIPSLAARPLDRIRVIFGGCGGSGEPRSPSSIPTFSICMCCATGAHQPVRVGLPRSGSRGKGPIGRWAYWWRSTNILPLDLIPSFTFISFTFVHSITD